MGRDSNPRYLSVHTLSRRAQSTALAPIRVKPTILRLIGTACKCFQKRGRQLRISFQGVQFRPHFFQLGFGHLDLQMVAVDLNLGVVEKAAVFAQLFVRVS